MRTLPLAEHAELLRVEATESLDAKRRSELGQFLTPAPLARFMASFFEGFGARVRLLDAGAGVGSLVAAAVANASTRPNPPTSIEASAFEVDAALARYLRQTLAGCEVCCERAGIRFQAQVAQADFVEAGVERLLANRSGSGRFTHAILNPPYKKVSSSSRTRLLLRRVGLETSNLYTAFVALAVKLLGPGGELVAITPRSFCNGPYFRSFRELLLRETAIRRVHLFESRTAAFSDDDVLQENVVFCLVKGRPQGRVVVSSSRGPHDGRLSARELPFEHVVRPGDPQRFFHLVPDEAGRQVAEAFEKLPATLADLGLSVSTGKVVDFRARKYLRRDPSAATGPLIYPAHFQGSAIRWPKAGKKPNALVDAPATAGLWLPRGTYVLVKRFSSKEEPRRIVAAVFDPETVPCEKVAFENHLNVFHDRGKGMGEGLARGLAAFLNSAFVDAYFRQYSGHTQVNATDLRNLRYPARSRLVARPQRQLALDPLAR